MARRLWQMLLLLLVLVAQPARGDDVAAKLGFKLKGVVQGNAKPALTIAPKEAIKHFEARLFEGQRKITLGGGAVAAGEQKTFEFDSPKGSVDYKAVLAVEWQSGEKSELRMSFTVKRGDALTMTIDPKEVDLDGRKLSFKLSSAGTRAELRVFGAGDKELALVKKDLSTTQAGSAIAIEWPKSELVYLKLRAWDQAGFWTETKLTPVTMSIPHQDIEFDFGKSAIRKSEEPKLEETLKKINQALELVDKSIGIRLYVAGYTDTMGPADGNRRLSGERARSIGRWFKSHGLTIPIFWQGFGEDVLAVKTPDETPEPQNRRASYLLATHTPPVNDDIPKQAWQGI